MEILACVGLAGPEEVYARDGKSLQLKPVPPANTGK